MSLKAGPRESSAKGKSERVGGYETEREREGIDRQTGRENRHRETVRD